ncbi:MAG TPA: PIG-L deacetylase family protein [Parapedobacter sp.]|uniref:PIG-L deacetylase family protein n=1 Tax=Parapedobacter sp. TaxID=1958893 RepID=UPI002CA0A15D|nr:PIG-L deacetylase family protein [Parapedobacter sp.]HWK57529.1 PIG-L deacetylase family protein [Parapedobacter sp.]
MKKVLVLAPHADDEILGCGATMARHIQQGDKVWVAVMTNASSGAPELFSKEVVDSIRKEALSAHEYLGVTETFFYEYPAPQLEAYPSYRIANSINELIRQNEITTLYIPFRGDAHKDHAVIFNAALTAARPINNCPVKEIFAYETLSETEWAAPFGDDAFIPNTFIDVSDFIDRKLEAMAYFGSQLKSVPHPRSLEIIRSLAQVRGSTIGVHYAEAFFQLRRII